MTVMGGNDGDGGMTAMGGNYNKSKNESTGRSVVMAQETHNGQHDHSPVRVAVWYDYI